jgi:hypothetical protein
VAVSVRLSMMLNITLMVMFRPVTVRAQEIGRIAI